jgi:DNA-binding Lrp family transcriptional regulator
MAYRRSSDLVANEPNGLDAINRRLLEELQTDGRVAFAELGRRVCL